MFVRYMSNMKQQQIHGYCCEMLKKTSKYVDNGRKGGSCCEKGGRKSLETSHRKQIFSKKAQIFLYFDINLIVIEK